MRNFLSETAQLVLKVLDLFQNAVVATDQSLNFIQQIVFRFALACNVDFFFKLFFFAIAERCLRKLIVLEFQKVLLLRQIFGVRFSLLNFGENVVPGVVAF